MAAQLLKPTRPSQYPGATPAPGRAKEQMHPGLLAVYTVLGAE